MQAGYRTILGEMLLAQSAALGAFADVTARCTSLLAQQYQAAAATFAAEIRPKGVGVRPTQPGASSEITGHLLPGSADFCRALAGLPRISMLSFLSRYDGLRGRRSVV
ncbi:hypothetical protein [Bradyrhizobium sp. ARR65]|uniref:hypothetical protein n=1 Tax=Bradyrhizobium sp. ARR65 TaxID=1040989 RepID=UPI0004645503|nr:hypothetical protein [Bradyrhizobium sp. ARR65]